MGKDGAIGQRRWHFCFSAFGLALLFQPSGGSMEGRCLGLGFAVRLCAFHPENSQLA